MKFKEAAILLFLISWDHGSIAIGSKRTPTKYLVSRGKKLVTNVGSRLAQKTISVKDSIPDKLSFLSRDTKKDDSVIEGSTDILPSENAEKESLFTPFLSSKFRENPGDFSEILFDKLLSKESAFAVKTIRKIIENFPSYGIIDVFSLHPTKDVVASVIALSRLQRITLESVQVRENMAGKNRYLLSQGSSSGGAMERDRKKHFEQDDYELLADLAHYATLAHCAYGWKFGLLSGRLHLGDKAMLQRKTGVQKSHIICAQWKSKTHLPAHFLVRDLQRKTIVLCIRGTLSPKDILTDLCCTADEFLTHEEDILEESESIPRDVIRNIIRPKHKAKAHHGMLQAAKNVAKVTRKVISTELASNPEFNLVIVGHSLGGGVAAVLGSLWRDTFPGVKVYAFGCPCVGPTDFYPYQSDAITCVVGEGDPFSCLSLGHLADASLVLSKLCQDNELRNAILNKTKKGVGKLDPQEITWCMETMKALETDMQSEKFYPPGRVLYMRGNFFGSIDEIMLREVNQEIVFRHLRFHPRMFDLSLHVPHRYEILLARIWNGVNGDR